ncbi:type II toxin-antitoxin system RelE/ParE family toxin [Nitrospirillum sp. BR 11828]|uniref:type II toxin-antitoxin system RelE/ParE family toxin n=1 Tax=Nitrospirillum sp. BR 11828 TaxID=3104325 RepID=UPI002ACA0FA4|nr:type II toxin-antitoxin system RelE/ParE family toxin [Nitrospirillum sp. BR 11828]MDZ5646827.1 type II toxin-antitoxin system RelE/ParE family toxin [Nitrospirillum sp. BR 11828]
MLPIFWRPAALGDLLAITSYIAESNPVAARRIKELIETSVLPAAEHPYIFRPGRVPGTREIVAHPNYIVVYQVAGDRIDVIAVVHTRRAFPS